MVALRTPAPMPRSFDQKQVQAGGRLNQPSATGQSLVREAPATQDGFRPFGQANGRNNNQAKPQPRAYERQGTPQPEGTTQPENRNTHPSGSFRPPQQTEPKPAPEWSHPLAKPVAPVQERNEQQKEQKFNTWQQQRPAPLPKPPQHSSPPPPRQEKPPKK